MEASWASGAHDSGSQSVSRWASLETGIWARRSIYSLWKWEVGRMRERTPSTSLSLSVHLGWSLEGDFSLGCVYRHFSVSVCVLPVWMWGLKREGKGTCLSVCGVWTYALRRIMALTRLCCLLFFLLLLLHPLTAVGQRPQRRPDGDFNSFSPTCHLSNGGELLCDQCQPGYTGPRCDRYPTHRSFITVAHPAPWPDHRSIVFDSGRQNLVVSSLCCSLADV